MSTWNDVTAYIKTQLKPGVLGNTNVQKILNSVLAIVNQINAANIDPDNDYLWDAETIYAADIEPVLWQDQWLVSEIDDNEGNVPISTAGVVHPTWRVIGSSSGSGIKEWEAGVYPNTLEIVFVSSGLYYLDRTEVGTGAFVSEDFATELAAAQWVALTGGTGGGLVNSIQEGTGIEVDATDPASPIVALTADVIAAIAAGVEANGWGDHAEVGYLTSVPYPAAVHRQNNTVLFDKDYIHDPAVAAQSGNILFDFTGAQLGATTEMLHDNDGAYTFPSEGVIRDFETTKLALVTGDVLFGFKISKITASSEVVEIRVSLTESQLAEYNA